MLLLLLASLVAAYLALVAAMAVFQAQLIYHPLQAEASQLIERAETAGLIPWRDLGGAIVGWKSAPAQSPRAQNRLVVFHGNAGYALHRAHFIRGFEKLERGAAWEVYLFEYPGFGARPGRPGERAFVAAGESMFSAFAPDDRRPIYLLGESLGSGLACALARQEKGRISGLLLITPYASITGVAAYHYPWLPVRWMLRDRWDNLAALPGFRGPVGVVVAGRDEIIPPMQGQALFDAAPGPKRLWTMQQAGHNSIDFSPNAPWWSEVSDFLLSARRE